MATAPKKTALSAAPAEPAASVAEVVAAPAPGASPQMFAAPAATLTELQGRLRAAAEKGLAETRSAYVNAKVAAEEAADALETSCAAARAGVVAINAKALELLTANVEANFDFVKAAFGVGGFADYVALQSEFAARVSTPSPARPKRSANWRRRPPSTRSSRSRRRSPRASNSPSERRLGRGPGASRASPAGRLLAACKRRALTLVSRPSPP